MNFFVQRYEIILIYANILRIIMQRNAIFTSKQGQRGMFQPHFPLFSLQDIRRQAQQAAGELGLGDVF